MEEADPPPLTVLGKVQSLDKQPRGLLITPRDLHFERLRGLPEFYAGIATVPSGRRRRIVLGQQPFPFSRTRLEVLGDAYLRHALAVETDDRIRVGIYHAEDWNKLDMASDG